MAKRAIDTTLLAAVLTLLGFGIVMVFSASSVEATVVNHNAYYYLERQMLWAGLGLFLMVVLSRIDYHILLRYAEPIAWGTFALLVLVLVPHIGKDINGARRWLGFGSLLFQPSEMAKFSLVLLFANRRAIERRMTNLDRGLLVPLAILVALAGLIEAGAIEPVIGRTYPLAEAAEAIAHVATGHARGKVVISMHQ